MSQFVVVCFAEGDFESAHGFDSDAEAEAFKDGCSVGAGLYGGDGFLAFTLPSDEALLDDPDESGSLSADAKDRAREAAHQLLNAD